MNVRPPSPEEQARIGQAIATFTPKPDGPNALSAAGIVFLRQTIALAEPVHVAQAQRWISSAAGLIAHSLERGVPLDVEHVFSVQNIDYYVATKPSAAGTERSKQTLASNLNRMRRQVLKQPKEWRSWAASPDLTAVRPYTPVECAQFLAHADQTTPLARQRLRTVLTYGLGVGADPADLAELRGTDARREPDGTVQVCMHTPGKPVRTVPALRQYEDEVWRIANEAGSAPLLLTRDGTRLRIDNMIRNSWKHTDKVIRPTSYGLRVTWLVTVMTASVRLDVIADAAGVKAQQLDRYIQFLTPYDPALASAQLRGERL